MAEPAKITPISEQNGQSSLTDSQPDGKKQLPGESALWFRRYCLYRDLGHKRSLRAAIAREQETARLVKEAEKQPQKADSGKKRGRGALLISPASPSALALAKVAQVPGSWKYAAKKWRWVDRAKAFDEWLLAQMAEQTAAHLGDTYANKFKRVMLIEGLITGLTNALNEAVKKGALEHDIYLRYVKQIAALVRQMEAEMAGFSEEEMKAAVLAHGRTFQDDIEKAYHSGQREIIRPIEKG